MRGVPGSGKSTLAAQLAEENGGVVCSTDDFFMIDGQYVFNAGKLFANHNKNVARVQKLAEVESPYIIVDNTNTQAWEASRYVELAVSHGYQVEFVQPKTDWAFDAEECAKRNSHGVPLDAIKRMIARWEPDITAEDCLRKKK